MRKLFFLVLIISFLVSCTNDELLLNPYDGIDYSDTTLVIDTLSPNSFVKLHRDVLGPSCNVMGCHDGTFEPDFRTVESSYNTLVYHPIIKNNLADEFTYRVVPEDTALSVLHERLTNCCFVNTNDRMPQDNIGNSLPTADLDAVSAWILDGAKDITGAIPSEPNNFPNIKYFSAMDADYDSTYSDNRVQFYMPFLMPENEQVNFIFKVNDDHTNAGNMSTNQLSISEYSDDFSNAIIATAVTFEQTNKVWLLPINTAILQSEKTYFMRYAISDEQGQTTTYPNNNTSYVYKSMWSFTVQ
tara:strand:+ start:26 stop:925 length:900 start_codon:yes stop_codon:yes gene_type:complete